MIDYLRSHLGAKLFLSYLIVLLSGILVMASAVWLAVPNAFDRRMMRLEHGMPMGGIAPGVGAVRELFLGFRAAVGDAVLLAILVSFGLAMVVSALISHRVVAPVRAMQTASTRIAEGHFSERVETYSQNPEHITDELGQLALNFNQMAESLEQTETMRRQLIADVAHELRTPLTAIKGMAEGLLDGVLEPQAENYEHIHREADRLERLVNDLQELSRVEAGQYHLEIQSVSISDMVKDVTSRLGRQYEEKGVDLEVDLHPDLPMVSVDRDRIDQVLQNLAGNALQYTPAGGKVTIRAQRSAHGLLVEVSDTGAGISPEHLDKVFTRFYRVDKSRARPGGGSGIGLTIARHWVEAHGGSIRAESAGLGKGSCFSFDIPIS
jgi:signal transduction histidine kinase